MWRVLNESERSRYEVPSASHRAKLALRLHDRMDPTIFTTPFAGGVSVKLNLAIQVNASVVNLASPDGKITFALLQRPRLSW
jgi:hypothetical protein